MSRTIVLLAALFSGAGALPAQTFSIEPTPPLTVPPSGNGGQPGACGNASNRVTASFVVPGPAAVASVTVTLEIAHNAVSDLAIRLIHGDTTVHLSRFMSPWDTSRLGTTGPPAAPLAYTFDDTAASSFDEAALGTPGTATIAAGAYRPDDPLAAFRGAPAAGLWEVEVCDLFSPGTGFLAGCTLDIVPAAAAPVLEITQPGGSVGPLLIRNTGGGPGLPYFNAMSLVAGAFPEGWFWGIDIPVADLVTEMFHGPPFSGTLDATGAALTVLPGPVPPGITVWVVSVARNAEGAVTGAGTPFVYVTVP